MLNGYDRRAAGRATLVAACTWFGFACQATPPHLILSDDAKVLQTPMVRQDEMYACGLASISALCSYWNLVCPLEEQKRLATLARENQGLSGGELCSALQGLGFETFLFQGELGHGPVGLMTQIDAQRPPLIMLSPRDGEHHYVLFMGYDEARSAACLLDPIRGKIVESYAAFEKAWGACDRFTIVAFPAESTQVQPIIEAGESQS